MVSNYDFASVTRQLVQNGCQGAILEMLIQIDQGQDTEYVLRSPFQATLLYRRRKEDPLAHSVSTENHLDLSEFANCHAARCLGTSGSSSPWWGSHSRGGGCSPPREYARKSGNTVEPPGCWQIHPGVCDLYATSPWSGAFAFRHSLLPRRHRSSKVGANPG